MASKATTSAQPKADAKAAKDVDASPKTAKADPSTTLPQIDAKTSKDSQMSDPKMAKSDAKPHAGDSKALMIHIDNFDAKKFHVINSPRSRDAMKELGIQDADLRLKTADDLRGMFNISDPSEKEAFDLCVKKHEKAHKNLIKKISERRKLMIRTKDEQDKKHRDHDLHKSKQLKHLEEEKKAILKNLELENKKREEEEKKKKLENERQDKDSKKDAKPQEIKKDAKAKDQPADDKAKKGENQASAKSISPDKKGVADSQALAREQSAVTHKSDGEKKLRLEEQLKESSILVFLDKSAQHKELLDLDLKERTKRDLERDKQRMKELMKKQKTDLLEMAQKRSASAYKSHENLGNVKTRKIEYLYDLSRNPLQMMKEKQQKEMEHMMNYEIALQLIKKQREDFQQNKHNFLKGEQQYKEIMFEYNKKILEREKQLKEQQKKIDRENKEYHVQRTKKQNAFERERMINKLTTIDNKAKHLKEDRFDYMESRKFMVQKLKKDLEKMKVGMMHITEIEKKYAFLHNDKEFQGMMAEMKKELHPGRHM